MRRLPPLLLLASSIVLACSVLNPTPRPPITATPLTGTQATSPTSTPRPRPTLVPTVEGGTMSVGPVQISGEFEYTNDIITTYYVEQAVALVDMYGFVIRDEDWDIPIASQTLGFLDIDPETKTGSYTLQLPTQPTGTQTDLSYASQTGVQIFAVSYWPNLTGGPFSEGDDRSTGWPSYLASVRTDPENKDEVIGGELVVWAPNAAQQFPTGFGGDGLLFTKDDPLGPIPAGYSIVDLDETPFLISQETEPQLTLYEPPDSAVKDYTALSYSDAFEQLYHKASTEWAFNGIKDIDWPAIYADIQPRVAEAEQERDPVRFYQAIHDFTLRIPDGHVGLSGSDYFYDDVRDLYGGGFGFSLREVDGGGAIVAFVAPDSPAAEAGIELGATILRFNDQPIAQAVETVDPYFGPYSTATTRRLDQAALVTRVPMGTSIAVTYRNPNASREETVTLQAIQEFDSYFTASIYDGGAEDWALPVEYRMIETDSDSFGYIRMNSNYDDLQLLLRLFERALQEFDEAGVAGLILDLRYNSGGAPLGLASYLYDEDIYIGQSEYYSDKTGQFEPEGTPRIIEPAVTVYDFNQIAILVGPNCASACEFEAYAFSKIPGSVVVGMYPSAGIYAEVSRGQFELPEGLSLQISTGRTMDNGQPILEGVGVVPDIQVPVTAENLLSDEDVELQMALEALQ